VSSAAATSLVEVAEAIETKRDAETGELEKHRINFAKLLGEIQGLEDDEPFEIEDAEDLDYAAEILTYAKKQFKAIDGRRKKVTTPMREALAEFQEYYKPTLDVLKKLIELLNSKIVNYTLEEAAEEALKAKKLAAAAREKDFQKAMAISNTMREVPKAKGITIIEGWDYEVTDIEIVPRSHMCVNDDYVKLLIKKSGKAKPEDVPGLRFFRKAHTRVG